MFGDTREYIDQTGAPGGSPREIELRAMSRRRPVVGPRRPLSARTRLMGSRTSPLDRTARFQRLSSLEPRLNLMAIASSSCDQAVSTSRRLDDDYVHAFSSLSYLTLVFSAFLPSLSLSQALCVDTQMRSALSD